MKKDYNPQSFWAKHALPFGSGVRQECDTITVASVYCRGNVEQLTEVLEPTPFVLEDARFAIQFSDYRDVVMTRDGADIGYPGYLDCSIILSARFGDVRGGYYWHEYESHWWSVAAGRELVGYPKMVGDIGFELTDEGFTGTGSGGCGRPIDVTLTYDDGVDAAAWSDLVLEPHLTIRALPSMDGQRDADFFNVVRGNTAMDHALLSSRTATAVVNAAGGLNAFAGLEVEEVLGGSVDVLKFQPARTGAPRYEVLHSYA